MKYGRLGATATRPRTINCGNGDAFWPYQNEKRFRRGGERLNGVRGKEGLLPRERKRPQVMKRSRTDR